MVIVDGKIGFLGGIDICLGRYEHETPRYLLYEPVEMQKQMNAKFQEDEETPKIGTIEISPDFLEALEGEENEWINNTQSDQLAKRKWHGKDQVIIFT